MQVGKVLDRGHLRRLIIKIHILVVDRCLYLNSWIFPICKGESPHGGRAFQGDKNTRDYIVLYSWLLNSRPLRT